jgi:membrane protease YdiL (CAAX protease family)
MQNYLLRPSKSTYEKISTIILGYGIAYLWTIVIRLFLGTVETITLTEMIYKPSSLISGFIMACIVAPLWEEFVFRVGIVSITKYLPSVFLIPIIIMSSALFGWLHGSPMNVLFQGVIGRVIAGVYVKNGYCWKSAVALHSIWNTALFIQVYLLDK